jgi:hypothetical protein
VQFESALTNVWHPKCLRFHLLVRFCVPAHDFLWFVKMTKGKLWYKGAGLKKRDREASGMTASLGRGWVGVDKWPRRERNSAPNGTRTEFAGLDNG